jgi:site-specific DNA-methyltransferase (adenine-specific)
MNYYQKELEQFKKFNFRPYTITSKHSITFKTKIRTGDRSCTSFQSLTEGCLVPSVMRFHKDHYNYIHPTQKPLELMKRLVEMLTPENGIVLDPFAGSFTTAIACLETGRRYVCIEKEDDYFEIGKNRISQWHNDKLNNCGAYELPEDIDRIKEEKSGQLNLF